MKLHKHSIYVLRQMCFHGVPGTGKIFSTVNSNLMQMITHGMELKISVNSKMINGLRLERNALKRLK